MEREKVSLDIFINEKEFHSFIINNIMSGEYKNYIKNTTYSDSKDFEMGFMLGMNWAALLTCQCDSYFQYAEVIKEEEDSK